MIFEPKKILTDYKKYPNLGRSARCQGFFVKPSKQKSGYDSLVFVLWVYEKEKIKIIGYLDNDSDTITFEGEVWHCDFDSGVPNYWNTLNQEVRFFTLEAYSVAIAGRF